jgi:hypothetical protein
VTYICEGFRYSVTQEKESWIKRLVRMASRSYTGNCVTLRHASRGGGMTAWRYRRCPSCEAVFPGGQLRPLRYGEGHWRQRGYSSYLGIASQWQLSAIQGVNEDGRQIRNCGRGQRCPGTVICCSRRPASPRAHRRRGRGQDRRPSTGAHIIPRHVDGHALGMLKVAEQSEREVLIRMAEARIQLEKTSDTGLLATDITCLGEG